MKKVIYLILLNAVALIAGSLIWKVSQGGKSLLDTLGLKSAVTNNNDILVYIDNEAIYAKDIEKEIAAIRSHDPKLFEDAGSLRGNRQVTEYFLQQRIEHRIALLQLQREGITNLCLEPPQADILAKLQCENQLIENHLDMKIYRNIQISDTEIQEYYSQHPEIKRVPAKISFRQIVLATEQEAIKARAGLNRSNFAERAKQLSISPEGENGGLMPSPLAKQELPPSLDVLFEVREGQIHGIIKSTFGFHLVLLEKKFPARVLTLEQAKAEITDLLLEKKKKEAYEKWFDLAFSYSSVRQSL